MDTALEYRQLGLLLRQRHRREQRRQPAGLRGHPIRGVPQPRRWDDVDPGQRRVRLPRSGHPDRHSGHRHRLRQLRHVRPVHDLAQHRRRWRRHLGFCLFRLGRGPRVPRDRTLGSGHRLRPDLQLVHPWPPLGRSLHHGRRQRDLGGADRQHVGEQPEQNPPVEPVLQAVRRSGLQPGLVRQRHRGGPDQSRCGVGRRHRPVPLRRRRPELRCRVVVVAHSGER